MLLIVALALLAAAPADDGFKPLVIGNDVHQFELVRIDPDAVTIVDGEVSLSSKASGYLATKETFEDFAAEFEFRYDRPDAPAVTGAPVPNSGLFVNIRGPPKVWPKCIEFQLANTSIGEIRGNGGGKLGGDFDLATSRRVTKPLGEWNRLELTSWHGTLSCSLNGVEVSKGSRPDPSRGPLGFQSEGSPVHFRKIRIKALD